MADAVRTGRPPLTALVGTLVFVAVVPGTVIGLVPYWISGWSLGPAFLGTEATRWLGVALVLAATPMFVSFAARFVSEGHGTPAPIAPTRHLVVGGPFRYTRNPGYVAVLALIVGQGLVFASAGILLYAALVGAAFQTFVVFYEEPTLRATFGAEYDAYCRAVPRWIPRPRRR